MLTEIAEYEEKAKEEGLKLIHKKYVDNKVESLVETRKLALGDAF